MRPKRVLIVSALAIALATTLTGAANADEPTPDSTSTAVCGAAKGEGKIVVMQLKDGRVFVNGEEVDAVPAIPAIPAQPGDAAPGALPDSVALTVPSGAPNAPDGSPQFTVTTEAGAVHISGKAAPTNEDGTTELPPPPPDAITHASICAKPAEAPTK
ncbi:hypothetical protein GCM10009555_019550 [Acrocarpospora macrocephala]|uniref:Lipoprotein n=1 Tax=Acrocarpospora macrocephala TaxID=150177 RepID=A0A5M3WG04_9ACTN|nr:hypothetical protein [Acrocarpospora macrocephala]GES08045.1 hypothetical protein Amac_016400 [Acrocarpospora macrocephala]